jgi:cobalt-zinc-cadmium efflux system membrane fusion protein
LDREPQLPPRNRSLTVAVRWPLHVDFRSGALTIIVATTAVLFTGCGTTTAKIPDPAAAAPPPAEVIREGNAGLARVDHPEQFPLATAAKYDAAPALNVTGVVSPDVSRNVPVISLASGRILEIHAKLGDTVTMGQLLLKVQSPDISQAFSDYRQAQADEALAKSQLDRAKALFDRGAIAEKDLEVARNAEAKAAVTVETTLNRLKILGVDPQNPAPVVEIHAPVAGVITDQQVTTAAGTQGLASPNAFTISDLSKVWIICDVYENDLANVHVGEYAEVRLNAYPGRVLRARISNISPIMDPAIHTAKVRLEVDNPGNLRLGMFVTATFHGARAESRAMVPATAVLHLHDRDWVYMPADGNQFQRVEVTAGAMLPNNMQEIVSGVKPGQRVVQNALVLQNTVEQ